MHHARTRAHSNSTLVSTSYLTPRASQPWDSTRGLPQSVNDSDDRFAIGSESGDEDGESVQTSALHPQNFSPVIRMEALQPRALSPARPRPSTDTIGEPRSLNASPLPSVGARNPPFSRPSADMEPRSLDASLLPNVGARSLPSSPPASRLSPRHAELFKWEDLDSSESGTSDSEKQRRELEAKSAALNAAVHRQRRQIDKQDRKRCESCPSTPFSPLASLKGSPVVVAASSPVQHMQPQDYLTLEMPDERPRDAA
jgi:hypothetical protein